MTELKVVECESCNGTGKEPLHKQPDGRCLWCSGKGKHWNVPYPMFCLQPEKCAGLGSCPLSIACCE